MWMVTRFGDLQCQHISWAWSEMMTSRSLVASNGAEKKWATTLSFGLYNIQAARAVDRESENIRKINPNIMTKLFHHDPKMIPKQSQNDPKTIPK